MEFVSLLDQKYSGENAVPCPNEGEAVTSQNGQKYTEHGNLTVHGSGAYLVCGRCGYKTATEKVV